MMKKGIQILKKILNTAFTNFTQIIYYSILIFYLIYIF